MHCQSIAKLANLPYLSEVNMIDRAVILSTGDELTTGRVVDTNSAVIADQLSSTGIEVAAVLKIGDDRQQLLWALGQARDLSDLVIGTASTCA